MFKITGGKGFHMEFKNGYTISVQFGPMNYCSNRSMEYGAVARPASETTEIADWDKRGLNVKFHNGDTVLGHVTADELVSYINEISSR